MDPTQRLLTALGRFQRQISRARDGQSDETWADESMTQLVNAIEVALEQSWKEVIVALTETARVLQSYIEAGKASQCIGFLGDSYEILCLMVGDLIVGQVRSGVTGKWEARYQRALEELANDGVTLIEDEEDAAPQAPAQAEPEVIVPEPVEPEAQVPDTSDAESEIPDSVFDIAQYEDNTADTEPPLTPMAGEEDSTPWDDPNESDADALEEISPESVTKAAERTLEQIEGATRKLNELDRAVDSLFSEYAQDGEEGPFADVPDISPEPEADKTGEAPEAFEESATGGEEDAVSVYEVTDLDDSWDDVTESETDAPEEPESDMTSPFPEPTDNSVPDAVTAEVERLVASMGLEDADPEETADAGVQEPAREGEPVLSEAMEEESGPTGVTSSGRLPGTLVEMLDSLCEHLSLLALPETDFKATVERIQEILAELESSARERDEERAVLPCLAMGRLVRLVSEQQALPDERFLDLAYAFCGLYAEAGEETQIPALQHWLRECDSLLVSWAALAREQAAKQREAAVASITMPPEEGISAAQDTPGEEDAVLEEEAPEAEAPEEDVPEDEVPEEEAPEDEAPEAEAPEEAPTALEPLAPLKPLDDFDSEAAEESDGELPGDLVAAGEPAEATSPDPSPPGVDEILDVLDGAKTRLEQSTKHLATLAEIRDLPASEQGGEDSHSPGSLLETASRAVSEGNVSNAKVLAMQAATRIAEAQAREAEARVEQTELRLKRGSDESEQARSEVHRAEQSVETAEAQVAECERGLEHCHEETEQAAGQTAHIQALIREIDDQIQALQQQREDAVRRKVAAETDLSRKETALAQAQTELEHQKSTEMEARVTLEDLRQQVKALERKRIENEAAMERAREVLNRQRASLIEMEKMISLICSNETGGTDDADGELLF